jgi:hypothetical protein
VRESDVETYLRERVREHGGFVRKARWVGVDGCPDRFIALPDGRQFWCELKAPGLAAKFPSNSHERQQHREHERMRAVGLTVLIIDSKEAINALLP